MKLSPPRLPAHLTEGLLSVLLEGELEEVSLNNIDVTKRSVTALDLDSVVIEKSNFLQAQLLRMTAKDIRIKQSDFSSASLSDGSCVRAEWINCRMTGIDFSRAMLHDVIFRDSKLNLANLRFTNLRRVRFIGCDLTETDFLGASLTDVSFESCQVHRTVFNDATCERVDLRSSDIQELSDWGALKGVTIDAIQLAQVAPYLAQSLGMLIR